MSITFTPTFGSFNQLSLAELLLVRLVSEKQTRGISRARYQSCCPVVSV